VVCPRDELEVATADEQYRTLTKFMLEAKNYLSEDGRVVLFFGTSGDLAYLYRLIDQAGFSRKVLAEGSATRDAHTAAYFAFLLRP
jgi:release factor glutamine methyltransferase